MRLTPIEDDHEAEYWVRQIYFGTGIAVIVTSLAMLRVALDWDPGLGWWLVPLGVAVLAQGTAFALPWQRIVRRPHAREFLFTWWLAELPLIYLYASHDPLAVAVYVAAVTLVIMLAAALYPPRAVFGLGVLSMAGLAVLILDRPTGNTGSVVGTVRRSEGGAAISGVAVRVVGAAGAGR